MHAHKHSQTLMLASISFSWTANPTLTGFQQMLFIKIFFKSKISEVHLLGKATVCSTEFLFHSFISQWPLTVHVCVCFCITFWLVNIPWPRDWLHSAASYMLYNQTCKANRGSLLSNRYRCSHLTLQCMNYVEKWWCRQTGLCYQRGTKCSLILQRQISSADQSIAHTLKPFLNEYCGLLISGPAGLIKFWGKIQLCGFTSTSIRDS